MSTVETMIRQRVEEGTSIHLADIGESAILAEAETLAMSRVFGDVVEALLADWSDLDDPEAITKFIVAGLRTNSDRHVLVHALDVLLVSPPPNLRPIISALHLRALDDAGDPLSRIEASAGLTRFALADHSLERFASGAILMQEDVESWYPASMLCRLAALMFEQFGDADALGLLERLAKRDEIAAEATFQRGMSELVLSLTSGSVEALLGSLRAASNWLRQAENADAERRDTRVYRLLAETLLLVVEATAPSSETVEELREAVIVRQLWDRPRPGAEWLIPAPEAELEWIPLVEGMGQIVQQGISIADAGTVLADAARVLKAVRSVRVCKGGREQIVPPTIGSHFLTERGRLGYLNRWVKQSPEPISQQGIEAIQTSITRHLSQVSSPGKPPRTPRSGQATSSKKSRPI